ncbi:hypothetical protein AMECASPLE_001889 [Ameca splendens]|uniref:Secreted protein n=1 Tax=Ameca splendens TaxID=208324 RepID=A0ABV0YX32_9TELE
MLLILCAYMLSAEGQFFPAVFFPYHLKQFANIFSEAVSAPFGQIFVAASLQSTKEMSNMLAERSCILFFMTCITCMHVELCQTPAALLHLQQKQLNFVV